MWLLGYGETAPGPAEGSDRRLRIYRQRWYVNQFEFLAIHVMTCRGIVSRLSVSCVCHQLCPVQSSLTFGVNTPLPHGTLLVKPICTALFRPPFRWGGYNNILDKLAQYISMLVYIHCKNKRVVLIQLGYLSCSFTAKECTYKQIS